MYFLQNENFISPQVFCQISVFTFHLFRIHFVFPSKEKVIFLSTFLSNICISFPSMFSISFKRQFFLLVCQISLFPFHLRSVFPSAENISSFNFSVKYLYFLSISFQYFLQKKIIFLSTFVFPSKENYVSFNFSVKYLYFPSISFQYFL